MSREDVGTALNLMADDAICSSVAAGDLSVLGDLDFNDDERAVVIDAAKDYPDVEGFGASKFSYGALNFATAPPAGLNFAANGRFGEASHYAFGQFAGPNLAGHAM